MSDTGFDVVEVLKRLPHRYPLLLVDRVKELVVDERIHAIKAVSFNEDFFQGHFPGAPIMPGVLQIEALAQAAGVLAVESLGLAGSGKLVYFMAIDSAKFRAPVTPGVLLDLEAEFVQKRARVCKFAGKASVDGKVTCEVQFTAMIADAPE
ncbi:3-hydroxyacyl-ACP dehydratase FabZ [Qipengyuania flava]|uniref:3-hydroxyacyl-ACP dehydratase FabZ n=1 Tax=Qipengyuania flava TaxID=192812 RepID=UPI001C566A3E|nr:3-hydroxyacyl-ACP dehydratase FabZ [Qipengyuania flava]MBW3167927.1 3-hydroxyacyl-ACP dehydratase FabZ [Qipengyuania flava]MBY5965165.1 3-hydroxyacyl-ACP dehydratase FabZ [Qipengyuania flava]MBY6011489.1 3-hydroxyacyl-ACP dehydratase FabZ [Qipengyuania flava]MBY6025931.1 3-hydroxyacyl-ACP dehydratase FabZ [Qipengyuania flava]